jgi:hypothetical protein
MNISNYFIESPAAFKGYGANWILSSLEESSTSSNSAIPDPRKELLDYLESPREATTNPIKWWGVCNHDFCVFVSY